MNGDIECKSVNEIGILAAEALLWAAIPGVLIYKDFFRIIK